MEIMFLGTRAADYWPGCFIGMENRFDQNNRRTTSTLIDRHILLDAGAHILDELNIADIEYLQITDIIITHFHNDHFSAKNIETIAAGRIAPLRLWVSASADAAAVASAEEDEVRAKIRAAIAGIPGIEIHPMTPGETYELAEDFRITGLPANHDPRYFPQHLLIEAGARKDKQKIFYGMDGGWLLFDTYQRLKKQKLDLMILDCTVGDYVGDQRLAEHNSLPMIRMMLPSLKTVGAIDDHTVIYIDHLAVTLHKSHRETVEICRKDGIHVAYDGLVIHSPEWLE